ncbi:MAG: sulfotransferase family 2 domain-containing protein, partial [Cytophagales bacterium]
MIREDIRSYKNYLIHTYLRNNKYVFLHIPKTAGTTFRTRVLEVNFKGRIFIWPREREPFEHWNDLEDGLKKKMLIISAHIPYGKVDFFGDKLRYITFLRKPIERVVSLYHFMRRTPDHYLYMKYHNLTIDEFFNEYQIGEVNNAQMRQIAGPGTYNSFEEMYDKAIDNVYNHFVHLGFTEDFDRSLQFFIEKYGWYVDTNNRHVNVTPKTEKVEPSSQTID